MPKKKEAKSRRFVSRFAYEAFCQLENHRWGTRIRFMAVLSSGHRLSWPSSHDSSRREKEWRSKVQNSPSPPTKEVEETNVCVSHTTSVCVWLHSFTKSKRISSVCPTCKHPFFLSSLSPSAADKVFQVKAKNGIVPNIHIPPPTKRVQSRLLRWEILGWLESDGDL